MERFTKKETVDFANIHWVALAAKKKDEGDALHCLHVSATGDLVALDGHRLHCYTIGADRLAPGNYEIVKKTASEIILNQVEDDARQYPDYTQVIPVELVNVELGHGLPARVASTIRSMESNSLSIDYLLAALSCEDLDRVQGGNGNQPVLFTGKNVKAVIMPVIV